MARPENQYLAESFIPSIIERRDMFVIEQEQIVRSTIRSLIAWRSTIDWVSTQRTFFEHKHKNEFLEI